MGRISYLIMAKQAKRDYLSNDKSSQKRDSSSDCSNENLSFGSAKYLYSFIATNGALVSLQIRTFPPYFRDLSKDSISYSTQFVPEKGPGFN